MLSAITLTVSNFLVSEPKLLVTFTVFLPSTINLPLPSLAATTSLMVPAASTVKIEPEANLTPASVAPVESATSLLEPLPFKVTAPPAATESSVWPLAY